jgi:hypothetical protein
MAGDWIKMRGTLLDHPKIVHIARELGKNSAFRKWLASGGDAETNGRICSDAALRCVTTALLMRVWSIARQHGHFVCDDLVLEHSELQDLDQMAGAPGVGQAMQSVRWAISKNGVTLPNFKEFNVPLTQAEKQKQYRERHGIQSSSVTSPLLFNDNGNRDSVTTRVEKNRDIDTRSSSRSKIKRSLPSDFGISERVRRWASEHGVENVERHCEHFIGYARANGKRYADWDQALMNAIRDDWAKIGDGRKRVAI